MSYEERMLYATAMVMPGVGGRMFTKADDVAGAARAVRGGETAATAYGRSIHKTFDYGAGFRREFTLPSGARVDAINREARVIKELKPDNPRAIRLGQRQLERYLEEANRVYPGVPWRGEIVTYSRP